MLMCAEFVIKADIVSVDYTPPQSPFFNICPHLEVHASLIDTCEFIKKRFGESFQDMLDILI